MMLVGIPTISLAETANGQGEADNQDAVTENQNIAEDNQDVVKDNQNSTNQKAATVKEDASVVTVNDYEYYDPNKTLPEKTAIENQSYGIGTSKDKMIIPSSLKINSDSEEINITYDGLDKLNINKAGTYTLTAIIPEGYAMADGIAAPKITIKITAGTTKITGLITSRKVKAGRTMTDTITVSPAYQRKVYLQRYYSGKWHTRKTYTTSDNLTSNVKLVYTKDWYARSTTKWRVYSPATENGSSISKNITVKAISVYQTPGKYLKVKDVVPVRKSGYTLKVGMSGMKVYKIQKRLGCYSGHAKYGYGTAAAVKRFQRSKGLKVTGKVDKATWLKMGFSLDNWYYMDSYVTKKRTTLASSKQAHRNAMIKTAKSHLGTKYIWCASARPKQGVDCAGLVIQCMYAAGIDPLPQGSHVYAYGKNEYTTRRMWANKKLKHVSYRNKKPGDIIFYGSVVNHVALYVGNGRIIEAMPGGGVRYNSASAYTIHGVARPII